MGFKDVSFVILDSTLRLRLCAGLRQSGIVSSFILFAAINGRSSTVRWTQKSIGKNFFFVPLARIAGRAPGVKPRRGFRPSYGHGQKRSRRPSRCAGCVADGRQGSGKRTARREIVQCPSSLFLSFRKYARMRHQPSNQVVKIDYKPEAGRLGIPSPVASGINLRQTGIRWDVWGGGRGGREC
jgi:hypothetical protein